MRRVALAWGGLLAILGGLFAAENLLPSIRLCRSFMCGDFDSGGVDVFGRQNFTPAQTIAVAAAIVIGGFMLTRAALPRNEVWTSVAASILILMIVLALAIPSDVVGAAPTRPCSTPGQNGRIQGECATGPAPTDGRLPDRIVLLVAGLAVLALGLTVDRQRRMSRQHTHANP
jgi:uncharacterized protein (DUF983 family)